MNSFKLFSKSVSSLNQNELDDISILLQEYYEEPTQLLNDELKKNNKIYYYRKSGEKIEAFFMTGWQEILLNAENRLLIYLGLSCVNRNYTENRLGSKLYYYFTKEALEQQNKISNSIILFGTTATPVILLTLPKIWDDVEPNLDGSYSNMSGQIITQIQKENNLQEFGTKHPFVLKKIASRTRYSKSERERFKEVCKKFNLKTFDFLNINETEGDRMLLLCNLPSTSKFQQLEKKLFLQNQNA